jgi:hypothetical protein
LFQTLGFPDMASIDAVAEVPDSDSSPEHSSPRVPLWAEPLALDEAEHTEPEWTPLPLMTPSPQYHAATYLRHASLRNVQKSPAASPLTKHLRNGLGSQPAYLGRVSSPFSGTTPLQCPGFKLGQLPRLAEAGA